MSQHTHTRRSARAKSTARLSLESYTRGAGTGTTHFIILFKDSSHYIGETKVARGHCCCYYAYAECADLLFFFSIRTYEFNLFFLQTEKCVDRLFLDVNISGFMFVDISRELGEEEMM